MPHINVHIPDELHKQCKLAATAKGMTLKEYILKELEEAL
jgi:predicted HicB family RNase H-like nuclease